MGNEGNGGKLDEDRERWGEKKGKGRLDAEGEGKEGKRKEGKGRGEDI